MVDSRAKGARAEAAAKKLLIEKTGLNWQRTPGSGALDKAYLMKGDVFVAGKDNKYCIEIKHYADNHFNTKILTDKDPQILQWWEQALRQANETAKEPLLIFKFDRSKFFIAFRTLALTGSTMTTPSIPRHKYRHVLYTFQTDDRDPRWGSYPICIAKLEDWLEHEEIVWIL